METLPLPPPSPPPPPPSSPTFLSRLRSRLVGLTSNCCLRVPLPRICQRLFVITSRNPLTLSYVLLIPPLTVIGTLPFAWRYGFTVYSEVIFLIVAAVALCQPAGSLLLDPATRPGRLYRLNPLVCVAETLVLIFRMAVLRRVDGSGLSWVAAARVLVHEREAVLATRELVEELADERKGFSYVEVRESLGFPPLRARGLDASASVSVIFIILLARACLADVAPGTRVFAMLYTASFAVLQGTILIATARELEPEEETEVEDELREYFLARSPDAPSPETRIDDGVLRFLLAILPCWLAGFIYMASLEGLDGAWALWVLVSTTILEIGCFALLRATRLGGWKSEAIHFIAVAVAYATTWSTM
ncbi:hypothetical protein GP486_007923 [Trichoglossum hirsutum]|uniref:Uncharacterized protein n=1 Tax=Trichoglossum hirsutum TaxID=265104 RepID=A0A9P8IGT9_9PEZI|nr:hypothetical protein GP486_007923 [Trichoglossum hirsutum]